MLRLMGLHPSGHVQNYSIILPIILTKQLFFRTLYFLHCNCFSTVVPIDEVSSLTVLLRLCYTHNFEAAVLVMHIYLEQAPLTLMKFT